MSGAESGSSGRDGLPTFELGYRYDDVSDPAEVTVYEADSEDVTTAWITASVEDAVRLDDLV